MKMASFLMLLVSLALLWVSAHGHPITIHNRQARDEDSPALKQDPLLKEFTDGLEKLKNKTQEDGTGEAVAAILQSFDFACQTHVSVMALKMGMQGYLFSESTPEALKNKPDEFYDNIVDILSSLEIAAAALQEIQIATAGHGCVEFAADQYIKIYNDNTITDKEVLKRDADDWETLEILANKLAKNTLSAIKTVKKWIEN